MIIKRLIATSAALTLAMGASASAEDASISRLTCSGERDASFTIKGVVKNIGSAPIEELRIIASFRAANDDLVFSGDAYADYQPLLPGQDTTFSVRGKGRNPVVSKVTIKLDSNYYNKKARDVSFTGPKSVPCDRVGS